MATCHLLVGLNGAGKSTLARAIAADGGVRLSLDAAMRTMHPALAFDDERYGELAERARTLLWSHAVQVLDAGVDVVLDWNCWSAARRARWRDAVVAAGHEPVLHHVAVPIDVAVDRARGRTSTGDPESHELDEQVLRAFVDIFEAPGDERVEGMPVVVHAT